MGVDQSEEKRGTYHSRREGMFTLVCSSGISHDRYLKMRVGQITPNGTRIPNLSWACLETEPSLFHQGPLGLTRVSTCTIPFTPPAQAQCYRPSNTREPCGARVWCSHDGQSIENAQPHHLSVPLPPNIQPLNERCHAPICQTSLKRSSTRMSRVAPYHQHNG